MSGGNLNPFKPDSIYEQIGKTVGHAVENIAKNPLPIIAAVALTAASGGLGIGAAAAEFAALEGASAAAMSAGVNAAIGNAASAALNGGNVSQIATAGIIAGLSAGAAAGLSGSDLIKSVTEGMDPATVKTITMSAGQSLGGAVTSVLQGKDPLTGALSGAIQGALTQTFSNGQLAELNSAAAKVFGNVSGAAASAAMTGGNVANAIANSAVYGSLKSGLSSAYDSFNTAKAEYDKSYNDAQSKMPDLITKAQDLLPEVQKQQSDAQSSYDKLQEYVKQYNDAKANNDSNGMTEAANAFNALKPTYDSQLTTFNENNTKLNDLSTQITSTNSSLTTQQEALQNASTQLKANYDTFTTNLAKLEQDQTKIDQQVSQLPTQYQNIYKDAVSKGSDGTTALQTTIEPYNKNVEIAKATIADLPASTQDTFKQNLSKGLDPSVAASNAQDTYTQNALAGLSSAFGGTGLTGGAGGDKGIMVGGTTGGLTAPTTGSAIPVDQNITDATGAGLNAPGTSSTGAAIGASPGGVGGLNPSLPGPGSSSFGTMSAELAPNTIMGTGLPGGGDIGVTYQLGANGLPAVDLAGNPIKASSVGLFGTSATSGGPGINVSAKIPSSSSMVPGVSGALGALGTGTAATAGTPGTTATTNTGFADLKPTLIKGGQFKFVNEPTFTEAPLTQVAAPSTTSGALPDYTPQILAAAEGGLIQNMATGQMPESVGGASRPTILRGNPFQSLQRHFGVQLPGFQQQRFDTGGPVMQVSDDNGNSVEHRPEFFSVGGLNSLENTYVKGEGDGTSDSVAAMLADGEFVIPADVVSKLGNGSSDAGAKVLDEFLATIREHNQKHDPKKLPPTSKGALAYLLDAKRKVS
jgi:predicted  nucleic acid-binding Zn-ribbon protein